MPSLADRPSEHVRRPGGGQSPVEKIEPTVVAALKTLVEPETGGDPTHANTAGAGERPQMAPEQFATLEHSIGSDGQPYDGRTPVARYAELYVYNALGWIGLHLTMTVNAK